MVYLEGRDRRYSNEISYHILIPSLLTVYCFLCIDRFVLHPCVYIEKSNTGDTMKKWLMYGAIGLVIYYIVKKM